jgi:aspartate/methionine/tyrosine aminotransferase
VANAGLGRGDVLAFWFGESDQPTPAFIRQAAARALLDGGGFYTHNLGRADLRVALSAYLSALHARPIGEERLAITSAGVSALMIAAQAVVSPSDRVVVLAPVWPNLVEIPKILSARVHTVALRPWGGRWTLDLEALLSALTDDTRVLIINSPNNPTGWMLSPEERSVILEHCRHRGIWILADDVYERLSFTSDLAPSFLALADPEDRVISANSFSKAWRMTGWRLGWLAAPASLQESLAVLLEYNTALQEGELGVAALRQELRAARDLLLAGLEAVEGVEAARPDGGMYVFFRVRGGWSSIDLATRLVDEVGLGLAPGSAFGPEGEGWLRWCFAARPEKNAAGLERLGRFLRG